MQTELCRQLDIEFPIFAFTHCRDVVGLLDGVAHEAESREFRAWLMTLAHGVAAAAKEGGFLGFGGTPVSEHEEAMLAELAEALQVR